MTEICPRCLGPLGAGVASRRYVDNLEVLICRVCRQEQECNAHGVLAGRPDRSTIVMPGAEVWPVPAELQFLPRVHSVDV